VKLDMKNVPTVPLRPLASSKSVQ